MSPLHVEAEVEANLLFDLWYDGWNEEGLSVPAARCLYHIAAGDGVGNEDALSELIEKGLMEIQDGLQRLTLTGEALYDLMRAGKPQ